METYYLIYGRRLVKGVSSCEDFQLADTAFEYIEGTWKEIDVNEINDILLRKTQKSTVKATILNLFDTAGNSTNVKKNRVSSYIFA